MCRVFAGKKYLLAIKTLKKDSLKKWWKTKKPSKY